MALFFVVYKYDLTMDALLNMVLISVTVFPMHEEMTLKQGKPYKIYEMNNVY